MTSEIHLNDLYHTVQGEGLNVGRRALFVRMPYCNLSCSWCDTSFNSFKPWQVGSFVKFAESDPCRFAVITGGEPAMHKHTPVVVQLLKQIGFYVAIETNGMFPVPPGIDWVCVSPKRDSDKTHGEPYFVCPEAAAVADEFKYVVDRGFRWKVLEKHNEEILRGPQPSHLHWLSPEFTNFKENVTNILSYVSRHPWWRLNLQTHKWVNIP